MVRGAWLVQVAHHAPLFAVETGVLLATLVVAVLAGVGIGLFAEGALGRMRHRRLEAH